ncbi:hypothetical protein V6Z12_D10G121400 [Gossypium hirsutum]
MHLMVSYLSHVSTDKRRNYGVGEEEDFGLSVALLLALAFSTNCSHCIDPYHNRSYSTLSSL